MPFIRNLLAHMTPAFRQMALHVAIVFAVAFGTALSAGATHDVSVGSLWALLVAAGAAGVTAVVHYLLGFVPAPIRTQTFGAFYHVPPAVEKRALQVAVSVVATFAVIFGSAALAGAVAVSSPATAADAIGAAIAAGVTGVVQYLAGLVPERV